MKNIFITGRQRFSAIKPQNLEPNNYKLELAGIDEVIGQVDAKMNQENNIPCFNKLLNEQKNFISEYKKIIESVFSNWTQDRTKQSVEVKSMLDNRKQLEN